MNQPIYLDYNATTPVDPRVKEKMCGCLSIDGNFGNPASEHFYGQAARAAVEDARCEAAALINSEAREIVWTSGATEAINLAIKGAAYFYQRKGKHIITLTSEHRAVLDCCAYLQARGFEISYLNPEANGIVDLDKVKDAIRPDTILLSVMHVNNEIGVIQDVAAIGELIRPHGIIFHVDAAQSAGKIPIDAKKINADLISMSAHKIYGPKGVGALYVRNSPRIHLEPQLHGGGQERGLRSGTLPTHQIVGMGEALRIAKLEMQSENERVLSLRNKLWNGIKDQPKIYLNGDAADRIAGNLNVSFGGIDRELLFTILNKDLAISAGAACAVASIQPSHVLKAIGVNNALAQSAVRFSLGRFTTTKDIDYAIDLINRTIKALRGK